MFNIDNVNGWTTMYNTKEYICLKMNWSTSNYKIGYLYKEHDKEVEQFYEG